MINIQEFRIGNFLLADNTMRVVCLINNDTGPNANPGIGYGYEGDCRYEDQSSDRLTGVPLSDALLEQFGFRFHPHFRLWQCIRPDGSYSIELDRDYSALDFGHRPIRSHVKYLHILQNLFFAIQGQELVDIQHAGVEADSASPGSNQHFVSSA